MNPKDKKELRKAIETDLDQQFMSEMQTSRDIQIPLDNVIAFIKERESRIKKARK